MTGELAEQGGEGRTVANPESRYEPGELDAEISSLEAQRGMLELGSPRRLATALFLANRYYNRHQLMSRDRRDLDRCIELLRAEVMDAPQLEQSNRLIATSTLGLALYHRAISVRPPGRTDLLDAIHFLRSHIDDAGGVQDETGAAAASALAFALQEKSRLSYSKAVPSDIDEAVDLAEQALKVTQSLDEERWLVDMAKANVAGVRHYRAVFKGPAESLEDLDRAIELLEPSVELPGPERASVDWPRRAITLASCLRDRAFVEKGGGREDHHRAIGLLREAIDAKAVLVDKLGEGHRAQLLEWEQFYSHLLASPTPVGVSLEDRWLMLLAALGHPHGMERVGAEPGTQGGIRQSSPSGGRRSRLLERAGADWAARDEQRLRDAVKADDWEAALTAISSLAVSVWSSEAAPERAAARLIEACDQFWASQGYILASMRLVGKRPRSWDRVRELAVMHVVSLVVLGRVEDALQVLDRVRAPGLSTLLRARGEQRRGAVESRFHSFQARYLSGILDEEAQAALREVNSISAELQRLRSGLGGFDVDDPALLTQRELHRDGSTTVALLPSPRGTLAVVEATDGRILWRLLPGASTGRIRGLRHSIDAAHDHMVRSVTAWSAALSGDEPLPDRYASRHPLLPLRETVTEACCWLGETIWHPLRDLLPAEGPLELLPFGDLALLPLHAAILPGGALMGERWFVRSVPTRVLPRVDPEPEGKRTLLVVDELGHGSPGHYLESLVLNDFARRAGMEIRSSTFEDASRWGGATVLHLSSHGERHDRDPRGIALASESSKVAQRLGFEELASSEVSPALVVSLACSSARPPADLPDDQASVATALLAAGASGVVAPLWDVPAVGATTLARWFYTEFLGADSPAEALADAQVSIHRREARLDAGVVDATADLFLAGIDDDDAVELFTATTQLPPAWRGRPWVGIESWAAFAYSGR